MTKASVKFMCGFIFAIVFAILIGKYIQEKRYFWVVFDAVGMIYLVHIMLTGYKDLPEK